MVAPCLMSSEHPLHMVNGVFNAVFVKGNMLGDSMYYGRGAGKLPTASAVVSDVIDCARHLGKVIMCFWDSEEAQMLSIEDTEKRFFFRVKSGSEEKVRALFGETDMVKLPEVSEEYGVVTHSMKERDFAALYEQLGDERVGARIRIA